MRLPVRPIATSAFCATLLLGVTGPAAMAADGDSARERAGAASRAPLPDADALNAQVQALTGLGGVVTPVTDLLGAVLKADDGRLSAEQADRLAKAVEDALAKAQATGTPIAPGTTTPGATVPGIGMPAQPPVALQPPAVAQPSDEEPATTLPAPVTPAAGESATASTGLLGVALDSLRKSVETLLGASTAAQPEQVRPAATGVVTDVVNVVAATLLGGGLPAPNLAGLPPLPAAPNGTTPVKTPADTPVNTPVNPS
ncbi:hypothetical protein AB0L74_03335 [Streptomyces sp. NPDC052020]|uniref:hypothetical protein n=1 Tax=Streptomyces sp. NPDC052020 TaxID=3155677 RepID=UPI0034316A62